MKIIDYKDAMNSINVDRKKILNLLENERTKENKRRTQFKNSSIKKAPIYISAIVIVAILIMVTTINNKDEFDITIKAYASELDENQILSKDVTSISTSTLFNRMAITDNSYGSVNFDLNFICDGEGIKSITYKISEDLITKENRDSMPGFFAENCMDTTGEICTEINAVSNMDNSSLYQNNLGEYYEVMGDEEHTYAKKMIGSSYTVLYENQNDINYALEVNFDIDENNNYIAEELYVSVIIEMIDQTIVERKIKVTPIFSDFGDAEDTMTFFDSIKLELVLE